MTAVLITGGAGFVGCNLARKLSEAGHDVTIFDNLSRAGVERNAEWLQRTCPGVRLVRGDVRDLDQTFHAVERMDAVFHLAAQVAVTTSVAAPLEDFQINAAGTLNVLEAVRAQPEGRRARVIFTSTNKVYGSLEDFPLSESPHALAWAEKQSGIDESQPLDLHSPYGCSKGAADQYVNDYGRIYGLQTFILRMSCIYGPRQFGNEDQGWVAHFLISAFLGRPTTIYGSGKQVRDLLFIDDLLDLFSRCLESDDHSGIFNVGGGPANQMSLLQLIDWIVENTGRSLEFDRLATRPGDQPVYVTDTSKAKRALGWSPQVDLDSGLRRLWEWIAQDGETFA